MPNSSRSIVGVVNGHIDVTVQEHHFRGTRFAVAATLICGIVFVVLVLALRGQDLVDMFVGGLLALLIPIGLVWLLLSRVAPRASSIGGRAAKGTARLGAKAAGSGAVIGAKGAVGAIRASAPVTCSLERHSFRVSPLQGNPVPSVLYGEPEGDLLRPGDIVRITGRRARSGQLVATRIETLQTHSGPVISVIRGHLNTRFRFARITSAIGYGWSILCIGATVVLTWPLFAR